jgi:phage protein D
VEESGRMIARNTDVKIAFQGVDISESVRPYMKSFLYTDNEGVEADDFQLIINDRDGIWLKNWLDDLLEAAAKSKVGMTGIPTESNARKFVMPFYHGLLNREPTPDGLNYWVGNLLNGKPGIFMGHGNHFLNQMNDRNLRNEDFVEALYRGILNRNSEPAGHKHWVDRLNAGNSRLSVFNGFLNSQEYQRRCAKYGIYANTPEPVRNEDGTTQYRVANTGGVYTRREASKNSAIVGTLAFNAIVNIKSVSGGWASYALSEDRTVYIEAAQLAQVNVTSLPPELGFLLRGEIIRNNWDSDGRNLKLDSGQFQLDEVIWSGPSNEVTIKGTSLPHGIGVRADKKTRTFKLIHLRDLASQIARECGMGIMFEMSINPWYEELEQKDESNIVFLARLCREFGITVKATNNILVLIDVEAYAAKPHVIEIRPNDGSYEKVKFRTGTIGNKAVNYVEIDMHGNPELIACLTVLMSGWGAFSGKYIIERTDHKVVNGYRTKLVLRSTTKTGG